MVPSKNPSSMYFKKFATVTGASFSKSSTLKSPRLVLKWIMCFPREAIDGFLA